MHLPTEVAKRVRAMAADIGPVPPEERRALLAEFQKSQSQLKAMAAAQQPTQQANEVPASSMPGAAPSPVYSDLPANSSNSEPSWTRLGVETLVRLVKIERPTVIAVVLQQLPAAQAAAVLQRLPRSTTREVLQTLGSMQDIDEEARQAIDEHLSERLRDYHHKMENELEQNRRMSELLSAAPAELKQQWAAWLRPDVYIDENSVQSARPVSATATALNTLDKLYQSATITTNDTGWLLQGSQSASGNPHNPAAPSQANMGHHQHGQLTNSGTSPTAAATSTVAGAVSPNATQTQPTSQPAGKQTFATTPSTAHESSTEERPHTIPFPGVRASDNDAPTLTTTQRKALQVKMEQMLSLNPEQLAQLLSSLDSQTILYSLAGASPSFMKRFCNMLEPEDAKVLDQRLKRIGTVNLRDIDQAQQRLVSAYEALISIVPAKRGLFGKLTQKRAA